LRACHAVAWAKAGWTPAQLHSTVHGAAADPCWSGDDRLVFRLADQLHDTSRVDDALWGELCAHLEEDALVELIMVAGLYHAVSYLVNATGVRNETFAPGFP